MHKYIYICLGFRYKNLFVHICKYIQICVCCWSHIYIYTYNIYTHNCKYAYMCKYISFSKHMNVFSHATYSGKSFSFTVLKRGRDHHDDSYYNSILQCVVVCCSVLPRVAVCCLQPLHHVPCAVAADTRPPASRCLPPPALTSTTAVCPL